MSELCPTHHSPAKGPAGAAHTDHCHGGQFLCISAYFRLLSRRQPSSLRSRLRQLGQRPVADTAARPNGVAVWSATSPPRSEAVGRAPHQDEQGAQGEAKNAALFVWRRARCRSLFGRSRTAGSSQTREVAPHLRPVQLVFSDRAPCSTTAWLNRLVPRGERFSSPPRRAGQSAPPGRHCRHQSTGSGPAAGSPWPEHGGRALSD
jgi:hypothetical protein